MKIRKGDLVQVISGKDADKGKQAKVLSVYTKEKKIVVEGVNIAIKHLKKAGTQPGQIIKIEKPIDASNVMLVCPFTNKPTRVGIVKIEENGKLRNYRYSKRASKDLNKEPKDVIIK